MWWLFVQVADTGEDLLGLNHLTSNMFLLKRDVFAWGVFRRCCRMSQRHCLTCVRNRGFLHGINFNSLYMRTSAASRFLFAANMLLVQIPPANCFEKRWRVAKILLGQITPANCFHKRWLAVKILLVQIPPANCFYERCKVRGRVRVNDGSELRPFTTVCEPVRLRPRWSRSCSSSSAATHHPTRHGGATRSPETTNRPRSRTTVA